MASRCAVAIALLAAARAAAAAAVPTPLPEALVARRATAALLGSFVADAAAAPLHWEYNTATIASLVAGNGGEPAFYPRPLSLWYETSLGQNTPYGQQALAYLSVGATSGGLAPRAVQDAYYALYKPGVCPGPSGGWYLDASTKEFVANVEAGQNWPNCGGDDNQADAVTHAIWATALYGGNTSAMLDAADALIRVTQATDDAAAFGCAAARLFEYVLVYNMSGLAAARATSAALKDGARYKPFAEDAFLAGKLDAAVAAAQSGSVTSLAFITGEGQSCDYAHTLPNVAFLAGTLGSGVADFMSGARQNILAGGDSGSRGVFIGALQGARLGDAALLPAEWTAKTTVFSTVAPQVAAFVAHRAAAAAAAAGQA